MVKFDFKNKLVLVLASSKGIGFEIAKQFYLSNAKVIICSRNLSNLNKAKKKISNIGSLQNIQFLQTDLSKTSEIDKLFSKIRRKYNKSIDILINNTGGPDPKKITQTTKKDWEYALNNNLKSFIHTSLKVLPDMKKKKWGRIVNLTSTTAKEPAVGMVLSNVSRAGVLAFSKTLSREIESEGVTINSILTGAVLTDRLKELIIKKNRNYKKRLKQISNSIPVKHIASTIEFAQLVLFLCSENASYVNGAAITIDGGNSKTIF
tara:strand:+ start:930 stop:1718 length:789 start_codon:yes stop_codon:yes gene_type:complete